MTLDPSTILSHYRILEKIGEGGMGVVYRALDTKLEREVALKVLRAEMAADPERFTRFEREARALASLNHPNIGSIHEIDEVNGMAFIAMELIHGQTLRERIAGRPLPLETTLDLALQIADALDTAHTSGIVHRDIKPPNILVTGTGRIKMLDFGLAKLTRSGEESGDGVSRLDTHGATKRHLTTPGTTMGTIAYMSPEQVRGEEIDARSDLFSFGAVLYEMATGRCAFSANTSGLTFDAILNRHPTEADLLNPEIPPRVIEIIDRALEKDRLLRYQSAADLRADLARVKRDTDSGRVAAESGSRRTRRVSGAGIETRRVSKKRPGLVALGIVLLSLAVTAVLYLAMPATPDIDALAVLPFEYSGDSPDGGYLSDGITEALINGLSKVPDLRVVPRSMVFPYKGKPLDPKRVGRDLKVGAVVTGRVTQHGQELTVSAELINVSTVAQIWGDKYTGPAGDIVGVPEEIARDISTGLRLRLTPDVEQRIARRYTENPDAFTHYVKSLKQVQRGTRAEFGQAIAEAEKALVEDLRQRSQQRGAELPGVPTPQQDPGYALAYARLARLYTQKAYVGLAAGGEDHDKAKSAAEFALQIDDSLAQAQGALAFVQFYYEWDWPAAEHGFKRALRLAPDDGETLRDYAWFQMAMGNKEEAVKQMRRSVELSPEAELGSTQLAELLFWSGHDDEALNELQRAGVSASDSPAVALVTACIQSKRGQHADAIATYLDYIALTEQESPMSPTLAWFYAVAGRSKEAAALLAKASAGEITPAQMGWVYAALGDKDQAFSWLNKAIDQHAVNMTWIRTQPWFDPLRSDPRFAGLLGRMKL